MKFAVKPWSTTTNVFFQKSFCDYENCSAFYWLCVEHYPGFDSDEQRESEGRA